MRQDKKRTERNREVLANMRSLVKNILIWTKSGETKKAESMFALTQQAIDMAAKKNLIHKNNAARRKAAVAKAMKAAGMSTVGKVKTKAKIATAPKPTGDSVGKKTSAPKTQKKAKSPKK